MPKFYRFADKHDIYAGMYRATPWPDKDALYAMDDGPNMYTVGSTHPTPDKDSKLVEQVRNLPRSRQSPFDDRVPGTEWYYGFSSVEQARRWLHDDAKVEVLSQYIALYIFEVPDEHYLEGYTQTVAALHEPSVYCINTYTIEQFINGEVK